ncbi:MULTISPECIES: heavy-metal-associated domain-containing protein [Celeribacter]|jgi:copper chaperone|uniref:Heavy-metal-associated domain-containing protein n=1 Tax=Celeribacter halophilus TaxID=576117 RepID=A0AAW7XVB2_9RHOB|nr:heavy-metal-associated domain-containing protein [Celeribacter halophilus]MBU2891560.1 heavy-metal-associated domain-containing protein [Celeribacter halophilus]MDO6458237.1 heavy-metal-associated domain-containing protein [Celeribacter halophilus]MDO6509718.1 heavy-metal-associated domain-containing protein [Celeribacter halophilus]MDO6724264.1 heavy-metal-associated domain-containing protein [Celeribacter halophilus]
MSVFSVPDMSCDHCKAAITEALEAVDDTVEIDVDMDAREIDVFSDAGDEAILAALKAAGYPAELKS